MEKVIPVARIGENTKPITRSHWKRNLIKLNGKCERNYIHEVSPLLMQSYAEIGAFPHAYYIGESPCNTHIRQFRSYPMIHMMYSGFASDLNGIRQDPLTLFFLQKSLFSLGVSALEFDTKGIYLASATRSGCLTVHKFESLYIQSDKSGPGKDEGKPLMHIPLFNGVKAVRWNPANQDEIACTSLSNNEVRIFDIGHISSQPVKVLRKRPTVSVHGSNVRQGLSDISFFNDEARVLASDICGEISIWDRRVCDLPQIGLTTDANSGLTSIQLLGDQCVSGASKSGFIYIWDLRGGRSSAASQSHKAHSSPLMSVELASMLNIIGPLKAQSHILPKEIQAININPSCPYQLGFHLDDGWSGVLDLHNFQVSHIHCPSPRWLGGSNAVIPISPPRKPSWLPKHSIYAVGSTSSNGLRLLDFYPHPSSPCHVDYAGSKSPKESKKNIIVPLSERVTACATHPLNGTIVAGTVEASLLLISQKHLCKKGNDDDEHS